MIELRPALSVPADEMWFRTEGHQAAGPEANALGRDFRRAVLTAEVIAPT